MCRVMVSVRCGYTMNLSTCGSSLSNYKLHPEETLINTGSDCQVRWSNIPASLPYLCCNHLLLCIPTEYLGLPSSPTRHRVQANLLTALQPKPLISTNIHNLLIYFPLTPITLRMADSWTRNREYQFDDIPLRAGISDRIPVPQADTACHKPSQTCTSIWSGSSPVYCWPIGGHGLA